MHCLDTRNAEVQDTNTRANHVNEVASPKSLLCFRTLHILRCHHNTEFPSSLSHRSNTHFDFRWEIGNTLFRSPLLMPHQFTLHRHNETLSPSLFDLFWGKLANHIVLHPRNWHWRKPKSSASQFDWNWYDDNSCRHWFFYLLRGVVEIGVKAYL